MVATNTFVSELQKLENSVARVLMDTRIIVRYTVGQLGVGNNVFIYCIKWMKNMKSIELILQN
jgi:hypothetical protein